MIEVSNTYGSLIAFDGRVLEVFMNQASERFHIKQIKSIEAKEKRKGDLEISGKTITGFFLLPKIDAGQKALVEDFIRQVKAEMG